MKRFISILAAIIILSAAPCKASAAPPDWTLVEIPAPGNSAPPVCIGIDGNTADIALDKNNNLYVMSGQRIIRFTPEGKVDTSWGRNGILYDGELEAENSEILKIAADSRGYVYALCRICEEGSPTFIKRYTPGGEADKSWYGDGIMGGKFAGEDFVSDETEAKGGIRNADAIAVDSKNSLYVLYNRRVYKFKSSGAPDKKMRKTKIAQPKEVYNEDGGGVWYSNAMLIDRKNNVYLFNGYSRFVSIYSRTGRPLEKRKCRLYYSYTDGLGKKRYMINEAAFDTKGNIYYLNQDGNSISKYSPKMKLNKKWCGGKLTAGKDQTPVQTITAFKIDTAGNIYILDAKNGVVSRYTNGGVSDKGWGANGSIGNINSGGKAALKITDIISGSDGSMYAIADNPGGGNAVIARINPDFTLYDTWGASAAGSFNGYITDAYNSMAVNNGYLYVEPNANDSAAGYNGLIRLRINGTKDAEWKITSGGPIWDVQTDGSGNIYVAGELITKYLPDGSMDEAWGRDGTAGGFSSAGEMAFDSSGRLYISDRGGNCILRYTPEGHLDINWGEDGKAAIPAAAQDNGEYYSYFIAVDSAGNLYLSDYINNRILRYNSGGQLDTAWCGGGKWKSEGSYAFDLMPMIHPTHLMICGGRLYAVWNGKLYCMNGSVAKVGVRPPETLPSRPAADAAGPAATFAAWQWVLYIGGPLLGVGAILVIILLVSKKKNKRRRLTKIKSIKIAKR